VRGHSDCAHKAEQPGHGKKDRANDSPQHALPTTAAAVPESGWQHVREMYRAEYATCEGITVAEIGRDYGFSTAGMTPNEVILKMEQESYYPEDQATTYEACLDAYYKRLPKY